MTPTPTSGQVALLGALARLTDERGKPPTLKELAASLGRHTNTIVRRLGRLERKGWIARRATKWRYNVITDAGRAALGNAGVSA